MSKAEALRTTAGKFQEVDNMVARLEAHFRRAGEDPSNLGACAVADTMSAYKLLFYRMLSATWDYLPKEKLRTEASNELRGMFNETVFSRIYDNLAYKEGFGAC